MKQAHVLLGARVRGNGQPSEALLRRSLIAAHAVQSGQATMLILSGGGIPSEAVIAADIVEAEGISPNRLRLEEEARNTVENIAFSWEIAREEGYQELVVITDPYQVPRALMIAKILGIPVDAHPAQEATKVIPPKVLAKAVAREIITLPLSVARAARLRVMQVLGRD